MSSIDAVTENLKIQRNRTYREEFSFFDSDDNPLDLSSYTILAECRKEKDEADTVDPLFTFNIDISDVANGNVAIYMTISETKALTISTGLWDMLFEAPGTDRESWIEGTVEITGSVTHTS